MPVGAARPDTVITIRPVGALIGGALGASLGVHNTLWIATVGAISGVLWLFASPIPRMRRLHDEPSATTPTGSLDGTRD